METVSVQFRVACGYMQEQVINIHVLNVSEFKEYVDRDASARTWYGLGQGLYRRLPYQFWE